MSSSGSATPQLSKQVSSPVLRSRSVTSRDLAPPSRKPSKTLPRGFTLGPGSESSGDSVFGLYGDLMNVENYECSSTNNLDASSKDVHNSDPELDTKPLAVRSIQMFGCPGKGELETCTGTSLRLSTDGKAYRHIG